MADSERHRNRGSGPQYADDRLLGNQPRDRGQALRILQQVESEIGERPWHVLSQENARVLLDAADAKPKVLISEPCAGLIPQLGKHFLRFLQRLGQRQSAPTLIS